MQVASPKPEFSDAAWVQVPTQLKIETLSSFCQNIEHVFRLNPYLRISKWDIHENIIHACWENHSLEHAQQANVRMDVNFKPDELCIRYLEGIKAETYLIFEKKQNGAALVILDRYKEDAIENTHEVDKSIHAWGQALNRFFKHYKYLNKIPGMEYVIDKLWIKLSPMARRITYILLVITAIEIFALLLFVLVMLLN